MSQDKGKTALGVALVNLFADAIHRAVLSTLPHQTHERVRHTASILGEMNDAARTDLAPLMGHLLDTGKVHPLLSPTVERMAGRR